MKRLWLRSLPATLLWLTLTGFVLLALVLPLLFRADCGLWASCGGLAG